MGILFGDELIQLSTDQHRFGNNCLWAWTKDYEHMYRIEAPDLMKMDRAWKDQAFEVVAKKVRVYLKPVKITRHARKILRGK